MTLTDIKVSMVIPTYNEAENIRACMNGVHEALSRWPHEVIVVDDNSPDRTWDIVSQFSNENPWARILRRTEERGLSSAVLRGFEIAKGPILGVMDADLSHDERILPNLVEAIDQGAEMAVGSRRIPGGGAVEWPWYRHFTSSVATTFAKLILQLHLSDPMSGFFLLRREVYERSKARLSPRGYKILVELTCKGKPASIAEIPFIFRNRKEGYSKLSRAVIGQYLWMLLVLKYEELTHSIGNRSHPPI